MAVSYAGLDDRFRAALQQLVAASHGRITLTSGFRTNAQQAALYKQKPNLAAPPGRSNHEKGLAADIAGDLALAHKLAPSFGLYFPMLNPKGKKYEPWHVELAGAKGASPSAGYIPTASSPAPDAPTLKDPMYLLATFNAILRNDLPKAGSKAGTKGSTPAPAKTTQTGLGLLNSALGKGGGDIDKFIASMRSVESSGNYKAIGVPTKYGRATGAYQYLDSTWNNRGGYKRAADAPAAFQDAEARKDIQRLYDRFKDWRLVAVAWNGGPGMATKAQGGKTAADGYASKVLAGMR